MDWMKGQTCGLCGKADGEIRQEYRTPTGYLTKSSVSFAHSWVLPAESCHDASRKCFTAHSMTISHSSKTLLLYTVFPRVLHEV